MTLRFPFSSSGLIIIVLFLTLFSALQLPAQKVKVPAKKAGLINAIDRDQLARRAANADLELRRYQERISAESRTMKTRGTNQAPQHAGISLRKNLQTASKIYFQDDMESGTGGWTLGGGGGLWHQTTRDANSPTHSWWEGVEDLGTYYTGARVNNALISPTIDLAGATGPVTLLFTENYVTERGWDFCMVDISTDGGTVWSHLRGDYGGAPSGDSYGWIVSSLDLTPYINHDVNIRFVFDTGDSLFNAFPGWFIDNVLVFDQGGSITGTVFYDWDRDGAYDNNDRSIPHWLVTASGPLPITVQTDGNGNFTVPLPLGSYLITQQLPAPWVRTTATDSWTVNLVSPGQTAGGNDFGNYRWGCLVEGSTFNDLNKDSLFTPGEPPGDAEEIVLYDSAGTTFETSQIPASGPFTMLAFDTGAYTLKEYLWPNWVATLPASQKYQFRITSSDTVLGGFLFGSYQVFGTGTINGLVFNDLNRNGSPDSAEPGLAGWRVSSDDGQSAKTDSTGHYTLTKVFAGERIVSVRMPIEWGESSPRGSYDLALDTSQTLDSINFGLYVLQPGSVAGTVFNDLNANGTRDPSDSFIPHAEVYLSGAVADTVNDNLSLSTTADDSGRYIFNGILMGSYQLRVALSAHYRQTYPSSMQAQHIDLGQEEQRTGVDFGLRYDSTFNIAYRSFISDSIAYARDYKGKNGKSNKASPVSSEATFDLVVPAGGITGLKAGFSQKIDPATITCAPFTRVTHDTKFTLWDFALGGSDTLVAGSHVILYARGNTGKPLVLKLYYWEHNGLGPAPGTVKGKNLSGTGVLDLPMPNEINLLESMFYEGTGSHYGIPVGLVPGSHSAYFTSAAAVWKSLFDASHHHINVGPARCLDRDASSLKSFTKTLHNPVINHINNKLFAEALALKTNIICSELGIIPYGFEGLIFEGDSANVFNGMSVGQIAARLDTVLSGFDDKTKLHPGGGDTCLCDSNYFKNAYTTIRMIDSAFSGPLDTLSFYGGLVFTPVRSLSDVPYLRLDSSFSHIAAVGIHRIRSYVEEPRQVALLQNYPNPFNPSTRISFTLPGDAMVSLKVYNILGQEVAALLSRQYLTAGEQEIEFNAAAYASGVYFYRLSVESFTDDNGVTMPGYSAVRKMVILK